MVTSHEAAEGATMTVRSTRQDHSAVALRTEAARARDGNAARRMLALAMVLEGHARAEAARLTGMDRQTLRDWVHRYNAAAMGLHLEEISRHVAPGARAVLVLDGAGWHGASALVVPHNLTLLPLPPYSPELNPVENVWQYLRQNQLSLRVWPEYEAIVETCCRAWNALMRIPDRVASITRREWARAVTN